MTITQATKGISLITDPELVDIGDLTPGDSSFIVGNGSTWVAESGATARTSLGLTIGTDVQAYNSALDAISGLSVTDGNIIVGNGSTWVAESGATARTSLGLGVSDRPDFSGLDISSAYTLANNTSQFLVENTSSGQSACLQLKAVTTGGSGGNTGAIYFSAGTSGGVTDNRLDFNANHQNSTTPHISILGDGDVGIGSTNPSYKLDVVGDIAYSGSLINTSDKTLKKNIKKCSDDFFEKLLELESITFNYINEKDTKKYFGFIAQDVEKIFPSLVAKRKDGTLAISTIELIPLLVQAVQKLYKEIKG